MFGLRRVSGGSHVYIVEAFVYRRVKLWTGLFWLGSKLGWGKE